MNTDSSMREDHDPLTQAVIGAAMAVHNALGCGFLEKVYENALAHEMRRRSLVVKQQHPVAVRYDGVVVGDYLSDLIVDDRLMVELKVVRTIDKVHLAQCMNYLRASGMTTCLLLNFANPRLEIRRISNTSKG